MTASESAVQRPSVDNAVWKWIVSFVVKLLDRLGSPPALFAGRSAAKKGRTQNGAGISQADAAIDRQHQDCRFVKTTVAFLPHASMGCWVFGLLVLHHAPPGTVAKKCAKGKDNRREASSIGSRVGCKNIGCGAKTFRGGSDGHGAT